MSSRAYALSKSFPTVLHVSDDQGTTWSDITPSGLPIDPSNIKDINVGYYNSYRVLVCGYNGVGVRISNNAGTSFTTVPGTTGFNFDKVLIQDSNLLWAFGDVIFRSVDGGLTWINTNVSPVTLYGSAGARVTSVFCEEGEPATVYMAINEKCFLTNGNINNVWTSTNSESVVPSGDIITSIYVNTGRIAVVCSNGVYHRSASITPPYYTWSNPLTLGYLPPYSNYMSGRSAGGSLVALIDAYGNIYEGTGSGITWNPVPVNTITFTASPPLNQRIVRYGNTRLLIYTDSPSKIYESVDNGTTVTLVDTFSSDVIGLSRAIEVDCLECGVKWELDENNPLLNTCIPVDPPSLNLCPFGYTYDSLLNQCVSNIDSSVIPPQLPYSSELCTPVDPTLYNGAGGYDCSYVYNINPCGYQLDPCTGSSEPILTDTNLSTYLTENKIIQIQGSDLCYTISQLPDGIYSNYASVVVTETFDDCIACSPKYPLYNCTDITVVVYTQSDLSEYVGQTVQLSEYPNDCWQVGPLAPHPNQDVVAVTVNNSFESCILCNPTKYQLGNCFNDTNFIISDSDLEAVLNKTISIVGYPGLCFSVGSPTCECIKISGDLGAGPFTTTVQATGIILNNRNQYAFTNGGNTYFLNWNDTTSRWELNNQTTSTLVGYSGADIDCPYTSYWVNIPSFSIESCSTVIYDVTVDTIYPDCECCITKNCI